MDALVDFLLNFYGPTPYFVIFGILVACGLGLPIPEDITLFAAGLLAYYGVSGLWVMVLVCFVGVILGDGIIFFLGHRFGRKVAQLWFFRRVLSEERLATVKAKLHDKGNRLIFAARFMPGLRAPIYFSAGTLHLSWRVFLFYDGLAALISVPTIVCAVFYFGDELDRVVHLIQRVEHGILVTILSVALVVVAKWYVSQKKLKQAN